MRATIARGRAERIPWWALLVQGVASLIIGALLLVAPVETIALTLQLLGIYWLITGIFSIVSIFIGNHSRPWWIHLLSGIMGIIAGVVVLNHPLWSSVLVPSVLVVFLGIEGILIGLLGIAQAFRGGGPGAAVLGVLSIIFGALLLGSPLVALSVFVSITAVVAVVGGIVAIGGAITLRAL